jgi:hypothetical protein
LRKNMPVIAGIVTTMLVAAAATAAVLNVNRDLVNAGAKRRRYRKTPRRKEGEVLLM